MQGPHILDQQVELAYYSNGGINWSATDAMPVFERKYAYLQLSKLKAEEQKQYDSEMAKVNQKSGKSNDRISSGMHPKQIAEQNAISRDILAAGALP